MSKRYTRRPHVSIGLFRIDMTLMNAPSAKYPWLTKQETLPASMPHELWAVCQDHAFHLFRQHLDGFNGGRLKMKDVVCVDSVPMEKQMQYKEARELCALFNKLAKEKEEGR